eukprot:m.128174 g.128174  ORF g.128174 m.128174 type:complete len:145 (+) comp15823_c2_seq4:1722-2156(+)
MGITRFTCFRARAVPIELSKPLPTRYTFTKLIQSPVSLQDQSSTMVWYRSDDDLRNTPSIKCPSYLGTVNQLWQIEFSPETERIVAMASAPAGERTASAVSRMLTLMTQGLSNVIIGGYSWRQNSLVQVPEPQLVGSGHTNPLC